MNSVQPISTAPLDGSFIILFGPSGYTSVPVRCEVCRWEADRRYNNWRTYAGDAFTDSGEEPTHWMPIPTEGWAIPEPSWRELSEEEIIEYARAEGVIRDMNQWNRRQEQIERLDSFVQDYDRGDGVFVDAEIVDERQENAVPEDLCWTDEEWERYQESQRREFRMGKAEHDRERERDGG